MSNRSSVSDRLYLPVIIIGAGRSGTNLLRDVLTTLPDFGTWPCDEINYIWRHGNMRYPTDEFMPEMATEPVRRFIRQAFDGQQRACNTPYLVEKTCANTLRVGFVDRVLPDARYLFIVRDGRDVVASAMKRWRAPLDVPYLAKKARFVPLVDIPYYGGRYLLNRLHRLRSQENRLSSWGPRFEGMQTMLVENSLAEICAAQWQRSVARAAEDLAVVEPERVYRLSYEQFVADAPTMIQAICDFLEYPISRDTAETITAGVTATSVGNWQRDLSATELAAIMPFLQPTLGKYDHFRATDEIRAQPPRTTDKTPV